MTIWLTYEDKYDTDISTKYQRINEEGEEEDEEES